jgi:hypothetical protein
MLNCMKVNMIRSATFSAPECRSCSPGAKCTFPLSCLRGRRDRRISPQAGRIGGDEKFWKLGNHVDGSDGMMTMVGHDHEGGGGGGRATHLRELEAAVDVAALVRLVG